MFFAALLAVHGSSPEVVTARAELNGVRLEGHRSGRVRAVTAHSGAALWQKQLNDRPVRRFFQFGDNFIIAAQLESSVVLAVQDGRAVASIEGEAVGSESALRLVVTNLMRPSATEVLVYSGGDAWNKKCHWTSSVRWGIQDVQFAPDGRYLMLTFESLYPPADGAFPLNETFFERRKSLPPMYVLLDIEACRSVPEFEKQSFPLPGRFSADGKSYELKNPALEWRGSPYDLSRVFDLEKRRWVSTSH